MEEKDGTDLKSIEMIGHISERTRMRQNRWRIIKNVESERIKSGADREQSEMNTNLPCLSIPLVDLTNDDSASIPNRPTFSLFRRGRSKVEKHQFTPNYCGKVPGHPIDMLGSSGNIAANSKNVHIAGNRNSKETAGNSKNMPGNSGNTAANGESTSTDVHKIGIYLHEDDDFPSIKRLEDDERMLERMKKLKRNADEMKVVECPICFDDYITVAKEGRQMMATQCGHLFCNKCIETLFKRCAASCPRCRKKIVKKNLLPIYL